MALYAEMTIIIMPGIADRVKAGRIWAYARKIRSMGGSGINYRSFRRSWRPMSEVIASYGSWRDEKKEYERVLREAPLDEMLAQAVSHSHLMWKDERGGEGINPYDVQIYAAKLLASPDPYAIEMKTGEGKTYVVGLAAAVKAAFSPVVIATSDTYLAKRDATMLSEFYRSFGYRVGVLRYGEHGPEFFEVLGGGMRRVSEDEFRKGMDIIYTTPNDLVFHFLSRGTRHLPPYSLIVDEIDQNFISTTRFIEGLPGEKELLGERGYEALKSVLEAVYEDIREIVESGAVEESNGETVYRGKLVSIKAAGNTYVPELQEGLYRKIAEICKERGIDEPSVMMDITRIVAARLISLSERIGYGGMDDEDYIRVADVSIKGIEKEKIDKLMVELAAVISEELDSALERLSSYGKDEWDVVPPIWRKMLYREKKKRVYDGKYMRAEVSEDGSFSYEFTDEFYKLLEEKARLHGIDVEVPPEESAESGKYAAFDEIISALSEIVQAKRMKEGISYLSENGKVKVLNTETGRNEPGKVFEVHRGLVYLLKALGKEVSDNEGNADSAGNITFLAYALSVPLSVSGLSGSVLPAKKFMKNRGFLVSEIPRNVEYMLSMGMLKRVGDHWVDRNGREYWLPESHGMYVGSDGKEYVVEKAKEVVDDGRAVIISTMSINDAKELEKMMRESGKFSGVEISVLTAENEEQDAEIYRNAGKPRTVTIIAKMAGRGVNFPLEEGVKNKGGIHFIIYDVPPSYRAYIQLKGRVGRNGNPGSYELVLDRSKRDSQSVDVLSLLNSLPSGHFDEHGPEFNELVDVLDKLDIEGQAAAKYEYDASMPYISIMSMLDAYLDIARKIAKASGEWADVDGETEYLILSRVFEKAVREIGSVPSDYLDSSIYLAPFSKGDAMQGFSEAAKRIYSVSGIDVLGEIAEGKRPITDAKKSLIYNAVLEEKEHVLRDSGRKHGEIKIKPKEERKEGIEGAIENQ